MKKNKVLFYAIWATVLLCILSIIVCIALGKDDDAAVAIIPPDISIDCYSILLDDSFVFFSLSEDSSATFYRQYFDGSIVNLGTIDNYVFNLGIHTLIGQNLYFYITTADSLEAVFNNDSFENHIYSIDLKENLLASIYSESKCLPGAIISSAESYIISRQSQRSEDNYLYTYLEIYDTQSQQVINTSEIFSLNDNTNIGIYMMNICTDGTYIYALLDERHEDGTNSPSIVKYDINLQIHEVINIDAISDYILAARVGEMATDGTYLYMKNYSGDSCVSIINNSIASPIIQENGLQISLQYTADQYPLFYRYGGTQLYLYDNNGGYASHTLDLRDDYLIKHIMVNNDTALVTLFTYASSPDDVVEDKFILVDISEISEIE